MTSRLPAAAVVLDLFQSAVRLELAAASEFPARISCEQAVPYTTGAWNLPNLAVHTQALAMRREQALIQLVEC